MATPFLLSESGSTRATAYQFGNKAVTIGNKTHVTWLDAIALVKGRTYDHETKTWGKTIDISEGCDNHTNPAITADADGHIHMAWGPHGVWGNWNMGCFKWARTEHPGDMSSWVEEQSFGYSATYACLIHTTDGADAIVYRGGESPASAMFQKKRKLGGWTSAQAVLGQEIEPQYTNMGAHVACAADGTLYMGCHFYNVGSGSNPCVTGDRSLMGSQGAAVLKSRDQGQTWTTLGGAPVTVPTLYNQSLSIPTSGDDARLTGLVTDSKNRLWALTCCARLNTRDLLLSCWANGRWETTNLAAIIPPEYNPIFAAMTIDTDDRKHIVFNAPTLAADADIALAWGHPSCEVFHITTDASGGNATCAMASTADKTLANWLPAISLPGIHHPVEKPVILYTRGLPGKGCSPDTTTEVYCVLPE